MASWQTSFHLLPKESLEKLFDVMPSEIPVVKSSEISSPEMLDKIIRNTPKYWDDVKIDIEELKQLLPKRDSWSSNALMFGQEDGDSIEVWSEQGKVDWIQIKFNLIDVDYTLIKRVLIVVKKSKCLLHSQVTGNLLLPNKKEFNLEIKKHRPSRYIREWCDFLIAESVFIV